MKEREQKRGGSGWAIGCGLMLFLGLPLYVLSIGPAVWIANGSDAIGYAIQIFYYPLELIAGFFPPFKALVEWYICFWK
jgi:hypothetical protein